LPNLTSSQPGPMPAGMQRPRTAVVTGAASLRGIGAAAARRYAADGWAVAALDRDGDGAGRTVDDIAERYGVPTIAAQVDVADESSVAAAQQLVANAVASGALPPVEAVANIAGIASPLAILDTTLEDWNRIMAVNATGTFLVTKAFLPDLIAHGRGAIVMMSSISAQQGGGVFSKSAYSAAKAAVLGFTRALARELGPTGITANAVAPGAVDTEIRAGSTDEAERAIVQSIPLGRIASVDDVASLVVFLSGDEARYITGTTVNINGGAYIA
jgi:2-hydroxycyclohexanecarboxyl-CoA dehydrogenase